MTMFYCSAALLAFSSTAIAAATTHSDAAPTHGCEYRELNEAELQSLSESNFSSFVNVLGLTDLKLDDLSNTALFLPNDDAFAKIPSATVEQLKLAVNKNKLTYLLLNHIAKGPKGKLFKTLADTHLNYIKHDNDDQIVIKSFETEANVVAEVMYCSAGDPVHVYIVDSVLVPISDECPTLERFCKENNLTKFYKLASDLGLAPAIKLHRTAYIPSDSAIDNFLEGKNASDAEVINILIGHLHNGLQLVNMEKTEDAKHLIFKSLSGDDLQLDRSSLKVNGIHITSADNYICSDKGVKENIAHIIDQVIVHGDNDQHIHNHHDSKEHGDNHNHVINDDHGHEDDDHHDHHNHDDHDES